MDVVKSRRRRFPKRNSALTFSLLILLAAVALVFTGCKNFLIEDVLDGKNTSPLSISPSVVSLLVSDSYTFTANGGMPPHTFYVVSGGGSFAGSTYTAPAAPATVVVRVTDSAGGTRDAQVNVSSFGPLGISPASITINTDDTVTFIATGGDSPYNFTIESGGGTIANLAGKGEYTAPSTPDAVTVRVTDSSSSFAEASVTVNSLPIPLGISPSTITMEIGSSLDFSAFGGDGSYTFSIVPPGTGSIDGGSGLYGAPNLPDVVTVRVTDGASAIADAVVNVVCSTPLSISPATLSMYVDQQFDFDAFGGCPPYTFSKVTGGGSIDAVTGEYDAPPTAQSVTIRVTDLASSTSDATVTVNDNPAGPLAISPTSITLGIGQGVDFDAYGGDGSYTFSIVPPGGGTIDSGSGDFSAPSYPDAVTVRVTDGLSAIADAVVNVVASPVVISPSTITLDVNETVTFAASGGVGSYTFTKMSGPGTVNSGTGHYDPLMSTGTAVIRADDGYSFDEATVDIVASNPVTISPAAIALEIDEVFAFSASGGTGSYTFSIFGGGGSIDPGTGEYTAPSTPDNVTVRVTDDLTLDVSDALVTVDAAPLAINPIAATINVNNKIVFGATGGVGSHTYSIVPPGGGAIVATTGEYTAPSTPDVVTIRVTDDAANTADATVTVNAYISNVNYVITSANFPLGGGTGESFAGDFEVTNQGTATATEIADWYVYLSQDNVIGDGDTIVDSGTIGPLNGSETTIPVIPFSGTWPQWYGQYYLLIGVELPEDDMLPNVKESAAIPVAIGLSGHGVEYNEPNNGAWDPTGSNFGWGWEAEAMDFGIVLGPGSNVVVHGLMETDGADIIRFNAGLSATIFMTVTWGGLDSDDALDLVVWPSGGAEIDGPYTGDSYEVIPAFEVNPPGPTDYTGVDLFVTVGNDFGGGWNPNPGNNRQYTLTIQAN